MRTRILLPSVLIATVGLVVLAPAASAQEQSEEEQRLVDEVMEIAEENGGDEFTAECVERLANGDSVDDCQEAPNLILPELDELVWGAISFTALFLLLRRYAYPAIKRGMENRSERIRKDLQAAEAQREEAEHMRAEYQAQLNDARNEAARIIEEARQTADQLKRDHEVRLQGELAELRTRAAGEIDTAKAQAMTDLRGEVAALAIGAAETVVQRNLDPDTQTQLVEDYINQVAAQSS